MKKMTGTVTGTKMQKTATVKVDRLWRHPIYKKIVTKSKTYLAHDELGVKVGNQVTISEIRPQSKRKRWEIIETLKKKGK